MSVCLCVTLVYNIVIMYGFKKWKFTHDRIGRWPACQSRPWVVLSCDHEFYWEDQTGICGALHFGSRKNSASNGSHVALSQHLRSLFTAATIMASTHFLSTGLLPKPRSLLAKNIFVTTDHPTRLVFSASNFGGDIWRNKRRVGDINTVVRQSYSRLSGHFHLARVRLKWPVIGVEIIQLWTGCWRKTESSVARLPNAMPFARLQ